MTVDGGDDLRVVAVLLHRGCSGRADAARRALAAHPPTVLRIVHVGAAEDLPTTSDDLNVVVPPGTSPAAALAEAVRVARLQDSPEAWLWILHDDVCPAGDALAELLDAARGQAGIGVVGPKLLDWDDPRYLLEVGRWMTAGGAHATGATRGDRDDGQCDRHGDCLAVSSAGMLVRADVWHELGGFDQTLGDHRVADDFCWRVHRAGLRVVAVPRAVAFHAEDGSRAAPPLRGPAPVDRDRRNAIACLVGNVPPARVPGRVVRCVVETALVSLVWLLHRQPRAALAVWGSLVGGLRLARRGRLRRRIVPWWDRGWDPAPPVGRRRRRWAAPSLVRGLADLREVWHTVAEIDLASREAVPVPWRTEPEPRGREHRSAGGPAWPTLGRVLAALGAAGLFAHRTWFAGGGAAGPALEPMPAASSDLLRAVTEGWHERGLGSAEFAHPLTAMFGLVTAVLPGSPAFWVALLAVAAAPLAAWGAWRGLLRLGRTDPAARWMAVWYGLIPWLVGASAQGRVGFLVAWAVLPWLAQGLARLARPGLRRGPWDVWRTGLAGAVVLAGAPLLFAIVAVAACTAALVRRPVGAGPIGRGAGPRGVIGALALSGSLLLPWSMSLVARPLTWLADVGLAVAPAQGSGAPTVVAALWAPDGPQPVALCAGVVLALAVLVSVVEVWRGPGAGVRRCAVGRLALVTASLVAAAGVSWVDLGTPTAGTAAPAWPGVPAALALVGAGWIVARALARLTRPRLAVALRAAVPVALLVAAAVPGIRGVGGSAPIELPTETRLVTHGEAHLTLLLTPAQGARPAGTALDDSAGAAVRVTALRGGMPQFGDAAVANDPRRGPLLAEAVASILTDGGGDAVDTLRAANVGWIAADPGIGSHHIRRLEAETGLEGRPGNGSVLLWRLVGATARGHLLAPGVEAADPAAAPDVAGAVAVHLAATGPTRVPLPEDGAARTLLVAESPHSAWSVRVDGRPVTGTPGPAGTTAYRIPSPATSLVVTPPGARAAWLWAAALACWCIVLLAAFPRTRAVRRLQIDPATARHGRRTR